ncbi:MAG: pilin [Magnetococcales bacterium]|nr:pilin [Magnetococcales bacterium]MBF0348879.1 pilin [Magnetococcales bacterium]
MKHRVDQKGFTLFEWMILIVIIGILSYIGIQNRINYPILTKTSNALMLANHAKSHVTEYYKANGRWPATNTLAGLTSPNTYTSANIYRLAVTSSQITLFLKTIKKSVVASISTIVLQGADVSGTISWTCSTSIANQYVPKECS